VKQNVFLRLFPVIAKQELMFKITVQRMSKNNPQTDSIRIEHRPPQALQITPRKAKKNMQAVLTGHLSSSSTYRARRLSNAAGSEAKWRVSPSSRDGRSP